MYFQKLTTIPTLLTKSTTTLKIDDLNKNYKTFNKKYINIIIRPILWLQKQAKIKQIQNPLKLMYKYKIIIHYIKIYVNKYKF